MSLDPLWAAAQAVRSNSVLTGVVVDPPVVPTSTSKTKGTSFAEALLKNTPHAIYEASHENRRSSNALISNLENGDLVIVADEMTLKQRSEECKFALMGRIILARGDKPRPLLDLKNILTQS